MVTIFFVFGNSCQATTFVMNPTANVAPNGQIEGCLCEYLPFAFWQSPQAYLTFLLVPSVVQPYPSQLTTRVAFLRRMKDALFSTDAAICCAHGFPGLVQMVLSRLHLHYPSLPMLNLSNVLSSR